MLFMSLSFKSLRSLHPCFHSTQYSQCGYWNIWFGNWIEICSFRNDDYDNWIEIYVPSEMIMMMMMKVTLDSDYYSAQFMEAAVLFVF